jgi:hypothetical protein
VAIVMDISSENTYFVLPEQTKGSSYQTDSVEVQNSIQVLDSAAIKEQQRKERIARWEKYKKWKAEQDSIKRYDYNPDTIPYIINNNIKSNTLTSFDLHKQLDINYYTPVNKELKKEEVFEPVLITNESVQEKRSVTKKVETTLNRGTDITLLILITATFIIAIIRFSWKDYINRILQATVNHREFQKLYEENNLSIIRVNTILNVFYILIFSVILKTTIIYYSPYTDISNINLYLIIIGGLGLYIGYKRLLLSVVGYISNEREIFSKHNSGFNISNKSQSLLLWPIAIAMYFINYQMINITILVSFIFIIVFYFNSCIRLFKIFRRKGVSTLFWILYLCALEILPILIAISLIIGEA